MEVAAAAVGAATGVLITPHVLRLVARVPDRERVSFSLRAAESTMVESLGRTQVRVLRVVLPAALAVAGLRFGLTATLPPFLVLFTMLVAVSAVDVVHYRIPNRILYPSLAISAALMAVTSVARGEPETLVNALIGAVLFYGFLLLPHLVYPAGMGYGDVKLGFVMGLHLGWIAPERLDVVSVVLWALIFGCALGVLGGVVVAIVRRRRDAFPFGPALAVGCVLAVLLSESLIQSQ